MQEPHNLSPLTEIESLQCCSNVPSNHIHSLHALVADSLMYRTPFTPIFQPFLSSLEAVYLEVGYFLLIKVKHMAILALHYKYLLLGQLADLVLQFAVSEKVILKHNV